MAANVTSAFKNTGVGTADLVVIIVYLAFCLAVGMWVSKCEFKKTSQKKFAVVLLFTASKYKHHRNISETVSCHLESPAKFENRIKILESSLGCTSGALRVVLCTKKLHIVSRKRRKEN